MKTIPLIFLPLLLVGCMANRQDFPEPNIPQQWGHAGTYVDSNDLVGWWRHFEDPNLDDLVELALANSPQQRIAAARIQEARGLQRSARATLFPQLSARAEGGRERNGFRQTDNYYEAGFDASYEIDLFQRNRRNVDAADARLEALEAQFRNVELSLVAEVARVYIEYLAAKKQLTIAQSNLFTQEKTLQLIQRQRELGEAPQLDVERSESLVNTTKASIPEFERLADNARLRLVVLTGQMPGDLKKQLEPVTEMPKADIDPLLMAPVDVLTQRPDIRAAYATLQANSALAAAATADLYPTIDLAGFFGFAESALFDTTNLWRGAIRGAVNLIDFGRIEGQIDAARAREVQAYEQYRQTILQAIAEVESALIDHVRTRARRNALKKAFNNAHAALSLSEDLYREGDVSFLDVLDAQRTVNDTDAALVRVEAAQSQSLVRVYKSLGVY